MPREFKDILLEHIKHYLSPLKFLRNKKDIINFFSLSGWQIDLILGFEDNDFYEQIDKIIESVTTVLDLIEEGGKSKEDIKKYIAAIKEFIKAIKALPDASLDLNFDGADALPKDFLNTLLTLYLIKHQPTVPPILELITVMVPNPEEIVNAEKQIIKKKVAFPMVQWEMIPDLVTEPIDRFKTYYRIDEWDDLLDNVNVIANLLFTPMAYLLETLGFITLLGNTSEDDELGPDMNKRMDGFLSAAKTLSFGGTPDETMLGLTMGLVPNNEGGPGLILIPFGQTKFSKILGDWMVNLNLEAALGGIQFDTNGVELLENPSEKAFFNEIKLIKVRDDDDPAFIIGEKDASHFSIKDISCTSEIAVSQESKQYGIYFILNQGKLVINTDQDGDGFLSTILPEGISTEFDLEIGYSNHSGFHFKGSGNLEIVLPTHISLGPVLINDLTLGLGLLDGFQTKSYTTLKLDLGPFVTVIEGLGLQTALSFPDGGGNLGQADLSFGFKPPTGVALSLDTGVVKGGGYLFFEPEKEQYGGALELVIADQISVVAIGLITTRFPDGSKGFSLLLLISVEFSPGIALGMGFFLTGIGGLIGINRTVNTDALSAGVKEGSVDHILFPEDVVANIQRIITDLREFFPPQQEQFIIGIMAKISWGVPTLLSIEFGLAVEFANPVRIAILGVIKLVLPTEDTAILRIQVNFIGIIDFEEGYLMFDASLYGSKILTFGLEGEMALRLFWGKEKEFLMAVGGFHPSYDPPAFLKVNNMKRMTLSILSGNPSLTLTTYFAVTSNTVQFGAAIDFFFKVSKFKVIGYFGFDVLFQFSPFRFIAGIRAGVEVKLGRTTLFSITLSFDLAGPTPWVAKGTASFRVLFIKIKVKFSKTWGERREDTLPSIPVLPKLLEAFEQSRNWVGSIPENRFLLTTFKSTGIDENEVIIHAMGTLTIRQTIVPLGLTLSKFGNYIPQDISTASVKGIEIQGSNVNFASVTDAFAPAEFKEMEDDDKLKSPSYAEEQSGAKVTSTEDLHMNYGINRIVEYEVRISDYDRSSNTSYNIYSAIKGKTLQDEKGLFRKMTKGGAVRRSELSKEMISKKYRSVGAISVDADQFTVASNATLERFGIDGFVSGTKAQADDFLKKIIDKDPSLQKELQVMPEFELIN